MSTTTQMPGAGPAFPCGYGKSDTNAPEITCRQTSQRIPNPSGQAGKPYRTITLARIEHMVRNPQRVEKNSAQWVIPSTYAEHDARTHDVQRERGQFHILPIDIDKGNPTLDQVQAALDTIVPGVKRLIYTSASATLDALKWRVMLPLSAPVPGSLYKDVQDVLFDALTRAGIEPDDAFKRTAQLVYLPNTPSDFYQHRIVEGPHLHLGPDHPIMAEVNRSISARDAAREAVALRRATRGAIGDDSVINRFNARFTIEQKLVEYGYTRAGDDSGDWRSPYQTTGSFATRNMGDHWVSLSGSDDATRVGEASSSGGRFGDAFDLFLHYTHGGDMTAAIRAANSDLLMIDYREKHGTPGMGVPCAMPGGPAAPPAVAGGMSAPACPIEPLSRDFDTLMAHARYWSVDDPKAVDRILIEAAALDPMRRETIIKALSKSTGLNLSILRDQFKALSETETPDHLTLARATLDQIGRENVICTASGLWRWQECGVWLEQEDRAVKQAAQHVIENKDMPVNRAAVDSVTEVLKTEIYRHDHAFNTGNPEAVNCLNGLAVLDAGRWTLRPHRREDYRTTQIPVAFEPTAGAPMFRKFLEQVFRDDPDRDDKVRAVLELIGYSLMAHARHEKFVMLIGPGGNGKSVLLAVLEALAGQDNTAGVAPSRFDNPYQRAHLKDKLVNIVSELRQGEVIADAELKAITSGETSTVERKHRDPFDMRPFCTCWFGPTHIPRTRDFSDALMRRAVILTFNRTFALHEQDPHLRDRLCSELPGILTMCLDAYAGGMADGFTKPASSETAKLEWRLEADQVAQFVEDRCERAIGVRTTSAELYDAYRRWVGGAGIRGAVNRETFAKRLKALGFRPGKGVGGTRMFEHVRLVAAHDMGGYEAIMPGIR